MSISMPMELHTSTNQLTSSKMKNYIFILIIGLAIALLGCGTHPADVESEHDHEHEDVKVLIIGYSDKFELFAEADPFVVGESSSILVHLTHLENFKPLQDGKVTFSIVVGTNGIRQTAEKPQRPGIYLFNLTPEAAGLGKVLVDVETCGAKHQLEVKGIRVSHDGHTAIHEAEAQAPHQTNAIGFTKEQSWKIDFATENPLVEPFGQTIKTVAQIQPTQGDEVIITARTNGMVSIMEEGLVEGTRVSKNQQLLTILGSGMAENSWNVKFAEAKNNYEKTKADFERMTELFKDKIIPEKELLAAKNEYNNAKALFDNMSTHFSSDGQRVVSPFNGFVKQVFAQNGQYVQAGQPILIISQNRSLLIKADVQQKYAPLLGAIASASIKTLHNGKTYSTKQLNGKVFSYGRSVNPDNFLIPVLIQIDNKADFVPGSFVEIYLKTLSTSNAITVPNTALLEEQGFFFVFVQITPELFEKKEVKIGATDGFKTEILDGLSPDDRIVSKGAMLVKLAQAAGALDPHSGHVH